MEEWLLLGRIDLERRHISPGNPQNTVLIEADFADPAPARFDQTPVTARITAEGAVLKSLVQLPLSSHRIQNFFEANHPNPLHIIPRREACVRVRFVCRFRSWHPSLVDA